MKTKIDKIVGVLRQGIQELIEIEVVEKQKNKKIYIKNIIY